jgi:hypothetical protein
VGGDLLQHPRQVGLHSLPGVRLVTRTIPPVINWCVFCTIRSNRVVHSRVSDWLHGTYRCHQLNRVLTHNNNVVKSASPTASAFSLFALCLVFEHQVVEQVGLSVPR